MTKFILHGGMTSVRNENNKKFYQEVLKDLLENPKILICLFSIEESRWEEEYKWNQKNFMNNLKRADLEFQLANKNDFIEQLRWADAVHFRGGSTLMLLDVLAKFPEFKNNLAKKTISGSSAGALFLTDIFYENDIEEIQQGLGIIPINLITHYQSSQYPPISDELFAKLKNKNNRELVLTKETEYKVYKIDL
jgi:hypothetical protein